MVENITQTGQTSPVNESTGTALVITFYDNLFFSDPEFVRMMQVIGRPPIIVLRTIGNLLTFFTMQRGLLKHVSTCFYMALVGLADIGEFSIFSKLRAIFMFFQFIFENRWIHLIN